MSLSHQSVQYRLHSGQRLTQADQAAVDEHLAACPECRAYAAFHQNLLDALPPASAPLRHSEREIRQQINIVNAKLDQRRWPNRIFRSTLSLAGVATALVLLLLVLIYIPRMMPARPTLATQAMLAPQATRLVSGDFSSSPASWKTYASWFESSAGTIHYRIGYPPDWHLYPGSTLSQPGLEGQTSIQNYERPANSLPDENPLPGQVRLDIYALPCVSVGEADCRVERAILAANLPGERSVEYMSDGYTVWRVYLYTGIYRITLDGYMKGLPSENAAEITTLDRILATLIVGTGSSPIPTPTLSAKPALPFLASFPIQPGTTWEYTNTGYTQANGDPQKIIRGTSRMKESIASVQTVPPYTIVRIQGKKTMVSADEGWQENGAFGLGDYEYWYVIQNNQVYLSYSAPDPSRINPDQMLLKYQFPMTRGSEWCTTSLRRGSVENPTPDPNSPCESRRVVMNVGPYQSQVGELKSCYEIHDVANSGDVITQFCEGIGIVSVKYDHGGTQFGSDQEMVSFTEGKGSALAPTSTPSAQDTSTTVPDDSGRLPTPAITGAPVILQDGLAPAVAVKGQFAYIGIGARLAAIDISQPAAPRLAAQSAELPGKVIKVIPLPNGPNPRVAASAGRYVAIFDAAAPGQLGLLTQSKLPGMVTALILDINTNWIYAGGMMEGDANKGFVTILDATLPDTLNLLATIQLPAPAKSLALAKSVLYVAQNGDLPKISAIPVQGNQFGAPVDVHFSALPIYSMTIAGDTLYIGTDQVFSALNLADPMQPNGAWDMDQSGGKPLPGKIFGFELRASAIYIAGLDGLGKPYRKAITPPKPIKASSTVDTASYIAVANGLMLVAGDPLEIYDIRDPQNIKLIGSYPFH